MPRFERETTRRGRSAVPSTRPRTRRWRRSRASRTVKLGTLTNLSAHELALVADALALVWLRRADLANLCRRLADHLLVGALDDDLCRGRHLERHAGARLHRHRMRVADLQLEVGAFERSAVADALDLEALLEPLRDAFDHVRDECPGEPVQRAVLSALGRAGHGEGAVVLRDLHALRDVLLKRAEWAGHGHTARLQRHGDAGRDFDWSLADSAHAQFPINTRLPDESDDLAADPALLRGSARDEPGGRGQDRDAHPAQHARETVLPRVDPTARLGNALQAADDPLAIPAELEVDDQGIEGFALLNVVVADVALLLHEAGDLHLHLRRRHLHGLVQRLVRVADAGEHVCDWIGQHSFSPTSSTSSCPESRPGEPARAGRSGRGRTS